MVPNINPAIAELLFDGLSYDHPWSNYLMQRLIYYFNTWTIILHGIVLVFVKYLDRSEGKIVSIIVSEQL